MQQMHLNSSFQVQVQERKQENKLLGVSFDSKLQNVTVNIDTLFNESAEHLHTLQGLADEVTILHKDVGLLNTSTTADEVARNVSERSFEKLSKDFASVTKQVQAVVSSVVNLESVKTRLTHLEQDPKVYFDVSFPNYKVANFSENDVLKFNDTRYNVGGGYNSTTGNFTAPTNGVYLFLINGVNDYAGDTMKSFNLNLRLEEATVAATTTSGSKSGSGTAFAILELLVGSRVYVTIDHISQTDTVIGQYFTSFMGVRLF
ncbi:uncharacterized protein LOC124260801 [Haliotis rubra]|uniref:uncharacterized protein LOC124260801 n=1 Tax=Haliotis rubra TaxID=36100 RepID=UPI001EE5F0DB|nr:uncharacterized protein LOC124260801 [Haliotis rubra]